MAATLVYALIRAVAATLRFRWHFDPEVLTPREGPTLFCVWHNRLALSLIMYREYQRRLDTPRRMAALVSASRDGGLVARVLEHFGVQPVRGSTSRRGPQALRELTTWARKGYDLAITPDGPRGPRYVIQPGAIALAQLTGAAVVPASYRVHWKIELSTWDRFQVPLPFSRVEVKVAAPFYVPRECDADERERFRQELQRRLLGITID